MVTCPAVRLHAGAAVCGTYVCMSVYLSVCDTQHAPHPQEMSALLTAVPLPCLPSSLHCRAGTMPAT